MDDDGRLFSTDEACRRAGVTYRQADYWVRTGAIYPEFGARGSGTRRRWTLLQVTTLRALGQLSRMGCEHLVMREAASFLLDRPLEEWHGIAYIDHLGRVGRHVPAAGWVLDLSLCREAATVPTSLVAA